MKPLNMRAFLLVFLALVAGTQSGPITLDDDTCATTCTESSKFGYAVGQKYSFAYEADSVTSLQGAMDEQSSLHIRATADLHVLSPCEFALTLRDVTLEQADPSDLSRRTISENSRQFKRAVEANPIKFSFQDGHVESLCADSRDPTWVVNLKRGIISGLQNTMESLQKNHKGSENDVAGVCDTEYKVAKRSWGGKTTVTKSKDLLACTDRHGFFSSMQATPYKFESDIKSLPLLKGTHECEQTISSSGILERSEIREAHTFRPFSTSQGSGATTTTRQLLSFLSSEPITRINIGSIRRTNLLFEHDGREADMERSAEEVMNVLQEICALDDIRPETPRLYSRLVYAMRKIDVRTMSAIHAQVERDAVCQRNSHMAKKFFHDAIPSVSTAASAALMRELIQNGELSESDGDMWLSSLAFVAQPSSDMLREVTPLLQGAKQTRKMYLSISTLVHTFCRQNKDCESNRDVQQILNIINRNLGYNCRESDNERILMSLKALGNTGVAVQALPVLGRCVDNIELPMEIRVAAIEAYNRMPCDNREDMINTFMNSEEDAELRIKAYLAVMKCPTESSIYKIREMLNAEEVNQVGSFVWTHLNNIKETSDIFKQEIKNIIDNEHLKKEFNLDARKFSRNYEGSMFLESLNMGGKVESNLIWSPKSFVPRSANLNLTVDMFGHSVNFLEIGGRVEGAEDYLQKMFGADGYFPADKRSKRSVNSDDKLKEANRADPKAAMYMKMFGNELHYWDLTDFTNVEKEDFNILDLLIELAKDHEIEWSRSHMFLDSEITVPTGLGLPLRLTVNGTATVDVKVGGKMDIRQIAAYPNSMDINGYIKPSGAIEVSSVMGLDAFVARTGLKMITTLHTSTEVDGLIKLDESRVISAKFNMPKDKIEILNVKTQFFITHREEEREQKMLTDNRVDISKCSGQRLEKALGLKVCADLSYPASNKADAPFFPFTGPITASVAVMKADDHKSYEFNARMETVKKTGGLSRIASLSFNTPGSSVDREIIAHVELDSADKKVTFNLKSPWKQATLDGSMTNKKELKSLRLEATMDKTPIFSAVSEMQIDARPKASKFSQNVQIHLRGKPVLTMKGDTKYVPQTMIDTDIIMDSTLLRSPITIKGGFDTTSTKNKDRWNTDLTVRSQFVTAKVSGYTQSKNGLISSRAEIRYNYDGTDKHMLVLNGKCKDLSKNKLMKYSLNTAVTSSEFPDYNMEFDAEISKNPKQLETSLELSYGENNKDQTKKISFSQTTEMVGNLKEMRLDHIAKLKWKAMELDLQSKVSHKHTLYNNLKTQGRFSYSPNKDITLDVTLLKDQEKMNGDILFAVPGREMRVFSNLEKKTENVFNNEIIMQWQKGGQVRAVSVYSRFPSEKRHEIKSELYGPVGKPSTVSGSATLKMDDFAVKSVIEHNDKVYRASMSYDYTMAQKKNMNGKLDILYPGRHITAESSVSSGMSEHSVNLKSMWDADKDQSKKFILNGIATVKEGNQQGDLKVKIPSRTISFSFDNKYDGKKFNTRGDISWAPQKTISIVTSGIASVTSYSQRVEGSIQINTPFYADEISMNVNHKFNRRQLINHIDLTYAAGKTLSSDINVEMTDGFKVMNNKFLLALPLAGYESLTLKESHSLSNDEFIGNIEGGINSDMIVASASGKFAGDSFESALSLTTPFRYIRKAGASWKHSFEGAALTAHGDASLNRHSVQFDLSHSFLQRYKNMRLNTQATVQTSFSALRNGEIQVISSRRDDTFTAQLSVSHNSNNVLGLSGDLSYNADIDGKITMSTPYQGFEEMSTSFFMKTSESPMTGHAEFKWAPNKIISLDVELTGNSMANIKGTVSLSSPYTHRIELQHEHKSGKEWKSNTALEYRRGKKIILMTSFANQRALDASFSLETPCAYIKELSASINHAGFGTNFNNKIDLAFESEFATARVNTDMTMRGIRYLVSNAEIASSHFELIRVNVNHQQVEEEIISKVDASFMRRHKIEIETHYSTGNDISVSAAIKSTFREIPSLIMTLNHIGQGIYFDNKISVVSEIMQKSIILNSHIRLQGASSQMIDLQFTSPFENAEELGLLLKHKYQGSSVNCHAEVKMNSRQSIIFNNELSFSKNIDLKTELTTPFRAFRRLAYELKLDGSLSRFNGETSLKVLTSAGEINHDASINFAGIRSIAAASHLTTPFAQIPVFSFDIKHGLRGAVWLSNFEMMLPSSQKIEMTSQINIDDINAAITIKTPFTHDIKASAEYDNRQNKHSAKASLQYAPTKVINAEISLANVDSKVMNFKLTTPFESFRLLNVDLDHSGKWNNFVNKIDIIQDSYRVSSNLQFSFNYRDLDVKYTLQAPFLSDISGEVSHKETSYRQYSCFASGKYDSKEIKANADLNLQALTDFSGEFSLQTPFRGISQLSVNALHQGDLKNFNNKITIEHNNEKSTYVGQFKYGNQISGEFLINTPYPYLEFIQAKFDSNGIRRNSAELSYTQNRKIEAKSVINMRNGLKVDIKFNAPFTAPVTADINIDDMKLSTDFGYGRKHVTVDAEASVTPLFAKAKISTPFSILRSAEMTFNGKGSDIGLFNFETSFEHNKNNKFNFKADFYSRDRITGKFYWTSSFKNAEEISLEFNHDGSIENFETTGMLSYAPRKKMELSVQFKTSPSISGHFTMSTPCQYFRNVEAKFEHTGNLRNFRTSGDITYNGEKLSDLLLTFSDDLSMLLKFNTPFELLRSLQTEITHKNNARGFVTNIMTMINDARYKVDANIKTSPESSLKIETPHEILRSLTVKVNNNLNIKNFEGSILVERNNEEILSAKTSLVSQGKYEGSFNLKTIFPIVRNIDIMLKHEGSLQRFINYAHARYNGNMMLRTDCDFSLLPLKLKASIETPASYLRSLKTEISHTGSPSQFRTHAELTHNSNNQFMGDVAFQSNPGFDVTFQINTPFEVLENVNVHMTHQGDFKNFQSNAEMTINSRSKYGAQVQFSVEPEIKATISIATPIKHFRKIITEFKMTENAGQYEGDAELRVDSKRFALNGKVQLRPIFIELTAQTPFKNYEELSMSLSHKGSWRRAFQLTASVMYQTGKKIEADIDYKNYGRLSASVDVKTPFRGFENIKLNAKHAADKNGIESSTNLKYGSNKYNADLNVKLTPKFEGNLDITSPIRGLRKLQLLANNEMGQGILGSNLKLIYGNGDSYGITVDGKYNSMNDMSGILEIKTPIRGYESMKISGSHSNDPAVKTSFEASMNNKVFKAEFDMSNAKNIEGSVHINTPFYGYEELHASISHSGDSKKFTSEAIVQYAVGKKIEAFMSFDRTNNIIGSFKLSCPCKYIGNINGEFQFNGDMYNFNTNAKVNRNGEEILVDGKYGSTNSIPTLAMLQVNTPFSLPITMEATNDYRQSGVFQTTGSLAWSSRKTINIQAKGTIRGSLSDLFINSNVQIYTPFRSFNQMIIDLEHQHNINAVNSKIDIDFNRNKVLSSEIKLNKHNSKFEITAPLKMAVSVDSSGSFNDMVSTINLEWNKRSVIQMEIKHKDQSTSYDIQRDISVRTVTDYRTMAFTTNILKNSYTLSHSSSFTWDEAQKKTISYGLDFNDQSRRYKHQYTLEAKLNTPIRSLALNMNHKDDSETYNTDASLMWDSERDQSRKISISNFLSKSGSHEIKISHPAFQKALVMNTKFTLNEGKVLFDGHTELDCFSSPLKIDVRVEDKAQEYGKVNYSATFGISHPATTIDIKSIAHFANSQSEMTTGLNIEYQTARRRMAIYALQAQINKLQQTLNAQIISPLKSVEISGDMESISRGLAVNMAVSSEGKSISGRFEKSNNDIDMKFFYSPDNNGNSVHLVGKYLTPTDMMFEAYHMTNGRKTSDGTLNLDMQNGNLLSTRVYWRPTILDDLKDAVSSAFTVISREARTLSKDASEALRAESHYKKQLISSNIPDVTPLTNLLREEANSFKRDGIMIKRALNVMYERNEFYLMTIDEILGRIEQAMQQAIMKLSDAYEKAVIVMAEKLDILVFQLRLQSFKMAAYLNRYIEVLMESLYKGINFAQAQLNTVSVMIGDAIGDYASKIYIKIKAYKEELIRRTLVVAEKAIIYAKPAIEFTVDAYKQVKKWTLTVTNTVSEKASAFANKVPVVYMRKKLSQAASYISELNLFKPMSDVHISARDKVKGAVSSFNAFVSRTTRKATRYLTDAVEILNVKLTNFIKNDDTKYAHELIVEAYKQVKGAFEYIEVEKNMKELTKMLTETLVKFVRKNAFYMVDDYLHLDEDKLVNYDPRRGLIEFQIWVPMNLPTIQMIPRVDLTVAKEMYGKLKEVAAKMIPEDFSPYDYYYQHKPNMENIYPPFDAYALISGAQHLMTFDKGFYEFAGSCSYTLAKDFVDNTFELLVNYNDNRQVERKSVTLRTEGKEIEIYSKGKVTVDGSDVELPLKLENVKIIREGDLIDVISNKGFQVSCDAVHDMCMLHISGWYYNKVAGLFGTYTNEKYDDFTTSDARLVKNVDDFTRTWVSGRCRSVENRARAWDSQSKHACQKLFNNQQSTFRRCYKVVDPTPFLQMCANDVIDDVTDRGDERSACKSAAMYVMSCKKEGVPLRLPRQCVACEKPSYDQFQEGEELIAYSADQSADVIFVVEEKPCNREALDKLDDIALSIDSALTAKGLTNNQFGLIGFGGDGIDNEEHTHTIASKILGSSKEFANSLSSLSFDMEGSNTDVLKTLRMAAKYPFRAGVAKAVVLLTCSECTEQAARYKEAEYNLRTRGIKLHVIMDHEFQLGETDIDTPKTSYLFGIDKTSAYTSRHVSDAKLEGDSDLFKIIAQPSSMCARLAQQTGGSFFNFNKLTSGRVRFQKHFIDVFSRRVAKSAEVPSCQVCECVSDSNGAGRSVCKPCESKLDEHVYQQPIPQQFYQSQREDQIDFEEYVRA